ncbi:MAG: tRNA uridine-5-carboxymethylaminomethyl(34) synthesis GTPase MnmE [Lachnospiraceae bacterium]|nr:tRNA uridine-5-carboxymethylaminomethyl(34) synthesis GTPase MnmE [Lachnospiraceae bacterium]
MLNDTIAAPATAMINSGIGIIRISGANTIKITSNLFPDLEKMKSHTIRYGFLIDGENIIDEVMVSLMKAPNSYTREDVVEINCHGGTRMMNSILECLVKNGARLAEPGEFTKRAFLNGRIDLAKAEAVMDIISSKNDFALKSSVSQLRGAISVAVKGLREEILYQIAYIEAALDDPEYFSLDGYCEELTEKIEVIINSLNRLLKSAEQGKVLKEGINTVIVGKPNVGKSSLLNFLIGEERAIVTDVAGTTRDILSESVVMDGFMLNIIDTAGIRQTEDEVEKIGVERTLKYAAEADLIIYLLDSSTEIDENDRRISELIKNKKVITLLNKVDLCSNINGFELADIVNRIYPHVDNLGDKSENPQSTIIRTSIKDGTGITEFSEAVKKMFLRGEIDNEEEVYITNLRHKEALIKALESIQQVKQSLDKKMPEDFLTIDMMNAYENLGKIIGEQVDDDLVNEIFGKFCVGK